MELLQLLRRLENVKSHSRIRHSESMNNATSLNFEAPPLRSEKAASMSVRESQVCHRSTQTEMQTKSVPGKHLLVDSEVQTDPTTDIEVREKGTSVDRHFIYPESYSELQRLKAEIAHLKNSNRYGDLILRLHAATVG